MDERFLHDDFELLDGCGCDEDCSEGPSYLGNDELQLGFPKQTDIHILGNPYKKYVCQNMWKELRGQNTCMLNVKFWRLKPICDTCFIHFDYH